MSPLATGRLVGALFLSAFVAYGGGGLLVASAVSDPAQVSDRAGFLALSGLLVLLNSVVVVAIGVLVHPVLRPHGPAAAAGYLAARVAEGVLLAVGVAGLMALGPLADEVTDPAQYAALVEAARALDGVLFLVAMTGLGLGSLAFCRVLLVAGLVPRPLALWGLAGYAVFTAGMVLDLLGAGVGTVLLVPGGLFEVGFGLWLVVRGFPAVAPTAVATSPDVAPRVVTGAASRP